MLLLCVFEKEGLDMFDGKENIRIPAAFSGAAQLVLSQITH